jgi:hypothetical protein
VNEILAVSVAVTEQIKETGVLSSEEFDSINSFQDDLQVKKHGLCSPFQ